MILLRTSYWYGPYGVFSVQYIFIEIQGIYNDNDNDNDNKISLFGHKFIQHY